MNRGSKKPILVLGCVFPDEYEEMVEKEIRAAVYTEEMARGNVRGCTKTWKDCVFFILRLIPEWEGSDSR